VAEPVIAGGALTD